MWKQKLGISLAERYDRPMADVLKLLKQIGFDAVSPVWNEELETTVTAAREAGLAVQSVHAPFGLAAAMWDTNAVEGNEAKTELLRTLDDCRRLQIPVMVAHVWIGFDYTFGDTARGFRRWDDVVRFAAECGVQIALENTEGEEYLFALMDHFADNDTVGFCWDSGHEMCCNHAQDLLARFGDRLRMTHLNDNLGISRFDGKTFWTDDLHLLPYDGIADWADNIARLRRSAAQEYLNFELTTQSKPNRHENDVYGAMELAVYFTEAYKRACRIAAGYSK